MNLIPSQHPREVQAALGTLRRHMAQYAYLPVDVPIIQPADLFLTRAGDQILHRLFTFERHGASLALRPEFTTPALRRYIGDKLYDKKKVARWQVAGIIFEDDPSNGSMRFERASSGAECIGLAGAEADAEIIAMAAYGCAALGHPVETIVLGDAQLLKSILNTYDLDPRIQRFVLSNIGALNDPALGVEYMLSKFDAQMATPNPDDITEPDAVERVLSGVLETNERGRAMGGRSHADIARRLMQRQQRALQREPLKNALSLLAQLASIRSGPEDALNMLGAFPDSAKWNAVLENWRQVVSLLQAYGFERENMRLVPILARDWEYYSGLMFELYAAGDLHVAGGGRYDGFARLIGAPQDIPAVGFTYYLDALLSGTSTQVFQTPCWEVQCGASITNGIRWAQALRASGLSVRLTTSESPANTIAIGADDLAEFRGTQYRLEQLPDLVSSLNSVEV